MDTRKQKSSVRWRIVLIYFMLVFIAMTIVSVFLIDRMEAYQISSLKENITKTVNESNLLASLGKYSDIGDYADVIQQTLDESWSSGFTEELSVVDRGLNIIASTNPNIVGRNGIDVFDVDMIISSFMSSEDGESDSYTGDIAVKNLCYVIRQEAGDALGTPADVAALNTGLADDGSSDSLSDAAPDASVTGAVYVRADLTSINTFLAQSRMIFVQAIVIALFVTVILGFVLARSITEPINDVTKTAQLMSQGDFSRTVNVKSNDEIGQLADMFNLLREKLDYTLSEISNEKNKLSTILKYMADGLIAIDLDGNIIHANPAAKEMLGIEPEVDLASSSYDDILGHISDETSLEHIKENCKEDGGQDTFNYGPAIFAIRYDRFKDESGKDVGIIVIMQDITERQKLEDMQTDFVANVSHELKTPLTNIKSYTETLLDGAIDDRPTAMSFLGIVDTEADRMNTLVRDLLQLSRLDHRQEQWNIKESNIVALVNTCVMKVDMTVKQKSQQLNSLYDIESDVRVLIDRDRFEQVIMNVLSNAIKYTDEGGRIDVDILSQDGSCSIIVQDNGIGIPEASLSRIFERFYRVDKARSRAMGGTGLGLAITKQIVEEHHGTIEAESREGSGTKITITLPLANRRGTKNID